MKTSLAHGVGPTQLVIGVGCDIIIQTHLKSGLISPIHISPLGLIEVGLGLHFGPKLLFKVNLQ